MGALWAMNEQCRLEASHGSPHLPHVAFAPRLRGSYRERRLNCSRTTTSFGGVAWAVAPSRVAFAPRLRGSFREKRLHCSRTTKSFGVAYWPAAPSRVAFAPQLRGSYREKIFRWTRHLPLLLFVGTLTSWTLTGTSTIVITFDVWIRVSIGGRPMCIGL